MVEQGYVDYHMHTAVTIDGKMDERDACERALAVGMREIAFTNHSMLTEPEYTMSVPALVEHWRHIQECQARYPEMAIRIGVELDYYPDREEEIAAVIRRYEEAIGRPFDVILGAVHHLNGVFFSSKKHARPLYEGQDIVRVYRDYFALAYRAVQSRLYDVMAHPDLIKKYTNQFTPPVPFDAYGDAVEPFVDALLTCRVGIELNTKGLVLPVGEIYPSAQLLGLYLDEARARGLEPIITLGSDAHKAERVGAQIAQAAGMLRRANEASVTCFHRRKRIPGLLAEHSSANRN